jgi:nitrous oxide reductase accessory protein NosL
MEAHYDRCSPGLIAFHDESAAVAFVREHGGHVLRFATMTAAARP